MNNVYLDVDGEPVPARYCDWLLVAPCGCVPGLTVAERPDGVITTAEQALADFTPNRELRRRQVAEGWTCRLLGDRRAAVEALSEKCPHTPKWGSKPRPTKAEHTWAAANKSQRLHLVPDLKVGGYATTEALCGSRGWGWSNEWWQVTDLPTCRRCERAAEVPS